MKLATVKTSFLVTTSCIALLCGGHVASAQATLTLSADSTWGNSNEVTSPSSGDNVDLNGNTLEIGDYTSASYGAPATAIGNITDTTGAGSVEVNSGVTNERLVDITVDSITLNQSGGNLTLNSRGRDASGDVDTVTVNVLGDITADAIAVTVTSTDSRETSELKVGGNINANSITLTPGAQETNTATLTFNGDSDQTVNGAITGGNINIGEGVEASRVTFLNQISSILGNVASGSTALYGAGTVFSQTHTNNGNTVLGNAVSLTALQFDGNGDYYITVLGDDISTIIDSGGDASNFDIGQIFVNILSAPTQETFDNVFTNASFTTDGALPENNIAVDGSEEYDIIVTNDGEGNVDFTITLKEEVVTEETEPEETPSEEVETETQTGTEIAASSQAYNALSALSTESSSDALTAVLDQINAATSAQEVKDILSSVTSDVSGGSVVASLNLSGQTTQATRTRLSGLRTGSGMTGQSSGDIASGLQAWGQLFGITADQDSRGGNPGYEADTIGFAVGADTSSLVDGATLGVALSYAATDVKGDLNADTDVDSYQLTLYGDYALDERTYILGQIGYTLSDNDTRRSNVGGSGNTASGSFDASQYSLRLEAGRSYDMDSQYDITLTPNVFLNYALYDADSYSETGAGVFNQSVESDTLNLLELGVGLDATSQYTLASGSMLEPKFTIGLRYDLIGDNFETTNTFLAGGNSFKLEGFDPAQTTFNIGLGLKFISNQNWDFGLNYDYEMKSDYAAHSGLLKWAYRF